MQLLRITDGTTTVTLSGDGGVILQASYVPSRGEPGGTVTEDAQVVLEGTASQVQAKVRAVQQLFRTAARWQGSGRLERVYVEYQHEGDASAWRAEVLDGGVEWVDDPMQRRFSASQAVGSVMIVSWTRRSEWEGASTALTWGAGAASTASITNGDGSPYNATDVTSGSIAGELPAPIALRIKNSAGTDVAWREFHVANLGEAGFSTNQHILTAATAASSWDPYSTHSNLRWICAVSSTVLAKCQGMPFRVIATLASASAGVYFRAAVYANLDGAYQQLAYGPERYAGDIAAQLVLDLGVLPVPPGGEDSATAGVAIVITARHAAVGAATLDHVQLLPAAEYVRLEQTGFSAEANDELVLDEVQRRVYADDGTSHYNIALRRGAPLVVVPGRANRIAVLFRESSGYTPGRAMTLSGSYRPRRLTL